MNRLFRVFRGGFFIVAAALSMVASVGWAETARVHFIDVGIGDSTLIEFPCAAVLIDAGGTTNEQLPNYLKKFFERRKDLSNTIAMVVLTHAHGDHVGHFVDIAEKYKILNLVYNGRFEGPQRDVMRWLRKHPEIRQYTPEAFDIPEDGITNPTIDPVKCPSIDPSIKVFWGDVRRKPGDWRPRQFRDKNSHNVVTRIDFGEGSMLFTGDLNKAGIGEMLKRHDPHDFDVDLLKIGHHGIRNGTTPEFVEAVTPEISILSRPADMAWPVDLFEFYSRMTSQTREPREFPLYEKMPGIPEENEDLSKRERKARAKANQKKFERVVEKAIYWTGLDGTIVVDVSDTGKLIVEK